MQCKEVIILPSLLNNANTQVVPLLRTKLLDSDGGSETSRATPNDEDVEWHGLSGSCQWILFLSSIVGKEPNSRQ